MGFRRLQVIRLRPTLVAALDREVGYGSVLMLDRAFATDKHQSSQHLEGRRDLRITRQAVRWLQGMHRNPGVPLRRFLREQCRV